MEIYKILMLAVSFLFVFLAVKKMRKGMSFEEYSLGRGLGLWIWFVIKCIFVAGTVIYCIDWSFLNYKISF